MANSDEKPAHPVAEFNYTASYCEENVWHLIQHDLLRSGQVQVVFISNRTRRVAMWNQRVNAPSPDPVLWDYHVIALRAPPDSPHVEVWDLDCRAGLPLPLEEYLALSFGSLPDELAPLFRLVDRDIFLESFSSDRSHMLRGDYYLAPVPPWDPPYRKELGMNLMAFVDMENDFLGEVLSMDQMKVRAQDD